MLNIGPDGTDASIPMLHQERLDWLAESRDLVDTLRATRPWIVPSTTAPDGTERYFAARDTEVYVTTFAPGEDTPTLEVVAATDAVRRFAPPPPRW